MLDACTAHVDVLLQVAEAIQCRGMQNRLADGIQVILLAPAAANRLCQPDPTLPTVLLTIDSADSA